MQELSRYIVGIDLGTTNSVVSYIDSEEEIEGEGPELFPDIHTLKIPQIKEPGVVEESDALPSFLYIPLESEIPEGGLSLPWSDEESFTVGAFAKKRGAEVPNRMVASAKSWLCHPEVDRTSGILPWSAPEDIKKMSPLDVSTSYMTHIRKAWNHTVAGDKPELCLEKQTLFLTVPASFDAVARELTVKAAEKAGLPDITLLEEPQAAFYSWINEKKGQWREEISVGDMILVCDIGGGTTDFSLIKAEEEEGGLTLKRVAVGEHILLGGDNMDLTLAYSVRQHFAKEKVNLDPQQMLALIHNCREAKEQVLNDPECDSCQVTILGRGRSVIGGTLQRELKRAEIEKIIIDGFFPQTEKGELPTEKRASGFKELGLIYASDSAVTKYLSKFLHIHFNSEKESGDDTFIHPTKILFNGGVTKASGIRKRVTGVLNNWLSSEDDEEITVLEGSDPDMAVSMGAAYYGYTKRGKGVRIRGGAGRSYYIGVETSMPAVPGMAPPIKAVCVVQFGMEEGTDVEVKVRDLGVVIGEHTQFKFLCSTTRKEDKTGEIIEHWDEEEILEIAPVETELPAEGLEGNLIPVRLHSYLSEIGTLELWCEATETDHKWKLEFNVRQEE